MFVFVFIGNKDIDLTPDVIKSWDPISFYMFADIYTWSNIFYFSYFILKISSLLSLFDRFFGIASKVCFLSILVNLGFYSNFGKVFHGYHFLIMTVGLISLVKRDLSCESLWPIQLLKIYASMIYFMAALNKIVSSGLDWIFSENLYRIIVSTPGKTKLALLILNYPPYFCAIIAFLVVFFIQLPAIAAPFSNKMGYYFFFTAGLFHTGVFFILGGHYNFLTHIVCLLVFLPLRGVPFKNWQFLKLERGLSFLRG